MRCPIHQSYLSDPNHQVILGEDRGITIAALEKTINACCLHLNDHPYDRPLAIIGEDPFVVLSWLFAAARTGHIIAITSSKEPSAIRDQRLDELNIDSTSQYWKIPVKSSELNRGHIRDPDAPLCILFTSGSSGTPKAVVHSFKGLCSSARFSNSNISLVPGDQWLLSLYMWHIGGLMISFRVILAGASMVILDRDSSLADHIHRKMITHVSLVPTQLHDLLKHSNLSHNLKAILVGGGMITPSLIEQAFIKGWPVYTTYGMTELASQMSTTSPNASIEELRTAGSPLGNWELKINDLSEISVKGSPLFLGYWQDDQIHSVLDQNGFFNTGDKGSFHNGRLYLIGRTDKMFISGGENIYPEEIELLLNEFVPVSIVVPVPNKRYGMRPLAFLGTTDISSEFVSRLREHLRNHLPKFKHPDYFLPWPSSIPIQKPPRTILEEMACKWISERSL